MSTHHIATLHMGLPREDMGLPKDFVAEERKRQEMLNQENDAVRKATTTLRKAEAAKAAALAERDAAEARWQKRQAEKFRFTDQQRSWWDEQAAQKKAHANYMEPKGFHDDKVDDEHEADVAHDIGLFTQWEHNQKMRQEAFAAKMSRSEKQLREQRALEERDLIVERLEEERQQRVADDYRTKAQMEAHAKAKNSAQAAVANRKFKIGETWRKDGEAKRQETEKELNDRKALGDEQGAKQFQEDEMARFTAKTKAEEKAKARRNHGNNKQKELVSMRQEEEKAAKRKAASERKAFHQEQRKKVAEAAVLSERLQKEKDELKAKNLLREVELATQRAGIASERLKSATEDMKQATEGQGSANANGRTPYEARMRTIYGSDAQMRKQLAKEAKEREALLAEREAAGPTPAKARYLDGLPFTPFAS